MDKFKYDFLTDIQGRWQADLLKGFFEANGVKVELFQESLGQSVLPTTLDILGNVQVYVPIAQMKQARTLLKEFYKPPKTEKPSRAGVESETQKKSSAKSKSSRASNSKSSDPKVAKRKTK